ncbi:hypothetical protein PIROE2DRAFT_10221 [Piromyces sp. E2]|nr:hypothetical protein PIROE2DRAFT_10221 [Piromyces sp. E2]|eukprot:OUM63256.1 hypothetical protein PIROE2DRAFT_10221 [Piromyces sp. E2]
MKFFTNLLTLLSASSALSYTITPWNTVLSENSTGLFRRDGVLKVGAECQKDMDSTEEFLCLGTPDKLNFDTYKTMCPLILSEKCKKFYENPFSYLPHCKDENEFKPIVSEKAMQFVTIMRELNCSTDGDGNLCPAAEITLKNKNINEEIIMKSCKSKKCYNALNNLLEIMVEELKKSPEEQVITTSGNDNGLFADLKMLLNDPSCSSQAKDDLNSNVNVSGSSDANTNGKNTSSETTGNASSGAESNIVKLCSSIILAIAISIMYY